MKRVVLGIVLLWAAAGRAADLTIGDFDLGGPSTNQAAPALDAIGFTEPGRSGVIEPRGGETAMIQAASAGQAFNSLRLLLDPSATLERSAPLAAELHKPHQPNGELDGTLYVAPTPGDLSYQTTGPQRSVPQALHGSSTPPGFAGSGSVGSKLGAIAPWVGVAMAGLLIAWAVTAAGISRAA